MSETATVTHEQFEDLAQGLNKAWIIICGGVIFSMQVGFALLEAGGVRKKNSHVVWHKLIINSLVCSFGFWLVGYAIGFGEAGGKFVGGQNFFVGHNYEDSEGELVSQYGHWVFQVSILCVVVAITGGSISERATLTATAIHSFVMSVLIYPFILAWTWGGGWLNKDFNYSDFTGSGIVHCTGAYAGLAGLLVIGPRYNRFGNQKKVFKEPAVRNTDRSEGEFRMDGPIVTLHYQEDLTAFRKKVLTDEYEEFGLTNISYTLFGGLILWFQFIFFNAGSSILIDSKTAWLAAEKGAMNTFLGGVGAGPLAMFIKPYLVHGFKFNRRFRDDAGTLCNAFLGGMVANGAGMNTYEPWEALIIGIIAGIFYCLACLLFEKLDLDDALEAWQLHGVCGTIGVALESFFNHNDGIFHGNPTGGKVLGRQLLGWLCISAWSFSISFIVWFTLKKLGILRWDLKTEVIGYDFMDYAENVRLAENLEDGADNKDERVSYLELSRKTTS